MKNFGKKLGAMALALVMAFGLLTTVQFGALAQGEKLSAAASTSFNSQAIQPAAAKTGDDGTTNWDFIEPVTHKKSVPSGYTGISTAAQLNDVRNHPESNYILMANIDLSKWGNWQPIGSDSTKTFTGTFDGNGYVIKNMTVDIKNVVSGYVYAGLFGRCDGLTESSGIKNLGIVGGSVSVSAGIDTYAGGIVGWFDTYRASIAINNCYNTAKINVLLLGKSASSSVGGIVGYTETALLNCYNKGEIHVPTTAVTARAGGVAGSSSTNAANAFANCYNVGVVNSAAATAYLGGIVGSLWRSSLDNCYNAGTITALSSSALFAYAGGITGCAGSSTDVSALTRCYNVGAVTTFAALMSNAGGISGTSWASISSCYNAGIVNASAKTASITYARAGGIVGERSASITDCYNVGTVVANATGLYTTTYSYAGGITGEVSATAVATCYNWGKVNASSSFAESAYTGGIVGYCPLYSSLSDCYYINSNSKAFGGGDCGITNTRTLTATQMKQQSSYTGFDFRKVWTMASNGYPHLRGLPEPVIHTHSFSAWKTTKAATCKATGTQTRSCSFCNKTETKTLAKLTTHKAGAWVTTVKATTTTAGKQAQKCTVCGKLLATKLLPANHTIKLNAAKVTLGKGESFTLKATTSVKTTVKWTTSNAKIATVSSAGVVKAVAQGSATITATTAGGRTAKFAVTVKAAPTSVKLSRSSVTLGVKESYTPSVSFNSSDAASYKRSWSSSNKAVATVDAKGKITAVKTGKATITVTTFNGKKTSITVNVKAAPTSVKLNKTSLTLNKGKTETLKVTLNPSGAASYKNSWSSSDTKIAKVDANGKVTAVAKGTATITVYTYNNNGVKCKVTVK